MPRVSVIIPTHNRADFVATAIRSVLKQTFEDFELIVVDDASSDTTSQVVASFRDPRVHYIRHGQNRGGAAARNTGIVNSSAEYVAFLDDDDAWYPDKLARQMQVMLGSRPEVAAVYTGYLVVDRTTGKLCARMVPTRRGNLYPKLLESNPIGGTSSVLLKKACLEKVGLFDESLPSFQDRDLWIRISREFHFECVPEPLLDYFVHPKKVWTNLDALTQGLEIMLKKYGRSAAFRKRCSGYYLSFGVKFCAANQIEKGRKALLRAVALYPYSIQPYVYFSLTLLGWRGFVRARATQAKMAARLGARRS
ncbi:MAG: glycosyltransferase family 2 protein [Candidatus Binatia bacterium]